MQTYVIKSSVVNAVNIDTATIPFFIPEERIFQQQSNSTSTEKSTIQRQEGQQEKLNTDSHFPF